MKKRLALSAVLAALLLVLLPLAGGCTAVVGQQTNATLGEPTPEATAADAAIAGVTKSPSIELPGTIEAGVLQAGSDAAFPPLAYLAVVEETTGGEVSKVTKAVGFEVDLCTAAAKKMGLTLKVVPTDWDRVVPALQEGRVDMIMSAMVVTPELQQGVSFADPHLSLSLAISAPLDAPVADSAGLAGKTVGVQDDSLGQSQVMKIAGVSEVRVYSTIVKAFADLADGRIQAVVNDEVASTYIVAHDPDLQDKVANTGTIATGTGYAFATKKEDTTLLGALNAALAELRAEGVYQKICAKWGVTGN